MDKFAILDGKKVVKVPMLEWGKWLETNRDKKKVAVTEVGNSRVSTVFLGIDHSWDNRPLWFETLVFDGPMNGEMERYTTYEEAEHGHEEMVKRVTAQQAGEK